LAGCTFLQKQKAVYDNNSTADLVETTTPIFIIGYSKQYNLKRVRSTYLLDLKFVFTETKINDFTEYLV